MKTSLRIALGVIILAAIIYFLKDIDFREVYSLLAEANNFYLFLAFVSLGISVLIFNLRGIYSISPVAKTGFWFNLKATLAGHFVNIATPGAQIGGEPVRAYYLSKRYKKSATDFFGAIIADRLFHVITALIFILISVLYILTIIDLPSELKVGLQTALILILFISLLALLLNSKKVRSKMIKIVEMMGWKEFKKNKKGKIGKIRNMVSKHSKKFFKMFLKVIKNKKIVAIGITLSLIHWLFVYLASYFLFLSFGMQINFLIVLAVYSVGSAIGEVSPTPGGVGLIEGSMILMYSAFGIGFSAAFAVSVLSRMILYFYFLVLGGISIIILNKETSKLDN
ncbi:MAG: flippase-like domain-containing protein [Candidatus Pacearchaeota archaeon]